MLSPKFLVNFSTWVLELFVIKLSLPSKIVSLLDSVQENDSDFYQRHLCCFQTLETP